MSKTTQKPAPKTANFTPPLAPQFVSTLQETTIQTLAAYLHATDAPPEVQGLFENLQTMSTYLKACKACNSLAQHVGIEDTVIETINLLDLCGASWRTRSGTTLPL